jgi:hypothetical protein
VPCDRIKKTAAEIVSAAAGCGSVGGMALITRKAERDHVDPPRRLEDDAEYAAFDARFRALTDRKAAIVERQMQLEKLHRPLEQAPRMDPETFERAARDMLANPPSEHSALPTTLLLLLSERRQIERALVLAQDEGRRVGVAALDRVRAARADEWADICKQIALSAHALELALRQRDKVFAQIGYGPFGRMPLPLSEFRVVVQRNERGAYPLSEIVNTALTGGVLQKGDVE